MSKTIQTYFLHSPKCAAVKIGRSAKLMKRFQSIQAVNADDLTLMAVIDDDVESAMHRRFSHLRIRKEWFHASPELLAYIKTLTAPERSEITDVGRPPVVALPSAWTLPIPKDEPLVLLSAVGKTFDWLPKSRSGRPPSANTLHRWVTRGLEVVRTPSGLATTESRLRRFFFSDPRLKKDARPKCEMTASEATEYLDRIGVL